MSHQMDSNNCCYGEYAFKIIGKVYALLRKTLVTFFNTAKQIFLILQTKTITTKNNMVLQGALCAVDAAKQFYKMIRSENNFNRFYDRTVTTGEEHNIDQPELPCYLRLQIENGSLPNTFTSAKAYSQ